MFGELLLVLILAAVLALLLVGPLPWRRRRR